VRFMFHSPPPVGLRHQRLQGLTKRTMRYPRCDVSLVLWDPRMERRNEPETAVREVPMW
jgi:hypothetical protein